MIDNNSEKWRTRVNSVFQTLHKVIREINKHQKQSVEFQVIKERIENYFGQSTLNEARLAIKSD
jgi:hypothetical protein